MSVPSLGVPYLVRIDIMSGILAPHGFRVRRNLDEFFLDTAHHGDALYPDDDCVRIYKSSGIVIKLNYADPNLLERILKIFGVI